MVETAEYRQLDDLAFVRRFDLSVVWAVAAQRQVSSGWVVVVLQVLAEDADEVSAVEDDYMV